MSTPSFLTSRTETGENASAPSVVLPTSGSSLLLASPRNGLFLFFVAVSLVVFWSPLKSVLHYATLGQHEYDQYSYTLAIPFISLGLLFSERIRIFATVAYSVKLASGLILVSLGLDYFARRSMTWLDPDLSLAVGILALVVFWLAGFICCYGTAAFRKGAFALWFLLLTVPIPGVLLDIPISLVRHGSTEVSALIFRLLGVHFQRHGFEFDLAHTGVFVAKECSGIHSTISIFIVSLFVGHLFLESIWKKLVLVLCALPIVCMTNGLRIAVLTLLAEFVDPGYLYGNFHHHGGPIFFLLGLLILSAILSLLRRNAEA